MKATKLKRTSTKMQTAQRAMKAAEIKVQLSKAAARVARRKHKQARKAARAARRVAKDARAELAEAQRLFVKLTAKLKKQARESRKPEPKVAAKRALASSNARRRLSPKKSSAASAGSKRLKGNGLKAGTSTRSAAVATGKPAMAKSAPKSSTITKHSIEILPGSSRPVTESSIPGPGTASGA